MTYQSDIGRSGSGGLGSGLNRILVPTNRELVARRLVAFFLMESKKKTGLCRHCYQIAGQALES